MPSPDSERNYETLTPAERDDVLVTLGPSDLLMFVETLAEQRPDAFDQVTEHLTRTVWSA